jgi:hypothetical protein
MVHSTVSFIWQQFSRKTHFVENISAENRNLRFVYPGFKNAEFSTRFTISTTLNRRLNKGGKTNQKFYAFHTISGKPALKISLLVSNLLNITSEKSIQTILHRYSREEGTGASGL